MRWIGRLLAEIMLGINVLIVLMLLLAAYSSYLNPQSFPTLSCMGLAFPVFLLALRQPFQDRFHDGFRRYDRAL